MVNQDELYAAAKRTGCVVDDRGYHIVVTPSDPFSDGLQGVYALGQLEKGTIIARQVINAVAPIVGGSTLQLRLDDGVTQTDIGAPLDASTTGVTLAGINLLVTEKSALQLVIGAGDQTGGETHVYLETLQSAAT